MDKDYLPKHLASLRLYQVPKADFIFSNRVLVFIVQSKVLNLQSVEFIPLINLK